MYCGIVSGGLDLKGTGSFLCMVAKGWTVVPYMVP